MGYLNFSIEELNSLGGFHTAREIFSQPDLWKKTYLQLLEEKDQLSAFLERFRTEECPNVILTGAGSSAFIGEALEGLLQKHWGVSCKAVGTIRNDFIDSFNTGFIYRFINGYSTIEC